MPAMQNFVKGALQSQLRQQCKILLKVHYRANYASNAKSEVLKVHYRANYASNAKC